MEAILASVAPPCVTITIHFRRPNVCIYGDTEMKQVREFAAKTHAAYP